MIRCQWPPGRTFISMFWVVKPTGPHHWTTCFGSVHILKTSFGGASKSRVKSSSRSEGMVSVTLFFSGISFLRCLDFLEVIVEAIEALLPELAIALEPMGGLLERLGLEPAGPPLGVAAAGDQTGMLQDF